MRRADDVFPARLLNVPQPDDVCGLADEQEARVLLSGEKARHVPGA